MVNLRWIRQYGTSIETFLGNRPTPHSFKVPHSIHAEKKPVDEFSNYHLKYKDHQSFYKLQEPIKPNNSHGEIPLLPSYIKGVDEGAYLMLLTLYKFPTIAQGKFFALRFFPTQHYMSLFRKSNIAYTFSQKGGFKLNDAKLEKKFDQYRGKYHNHPFFARTIKPLDTAFNRHRYRWYVRGVLHDTIRDLVPQDQVHSVEGIFQFQFGVVPTCPEDRLEIRRLIKDGVLKVLNNKAYQRKLLSVCKQQNKPRLIKQLKQQVLATNKRDLSVESVAKKLPFLNDEKYLV